MYDEVSVCVYIYRRNLFISLHKNLIYLCIRGEKNEKREISPYCISKYAGKPYLLFIYHFPKNKPYFS